MVESIVLLVGDSIDGRPEDCAVNLDHAFFCSHSKRFRTSPPGLFQQADAVVFAVANVDAAAADEYAVRARQLAGEWIAVGTVTALARAGDSRDDAGLEIDPADRVVFRVHNVKHPVGGVRNSLGPI